MTGELVIEPPTLINLGFEWLIKGDDIKAAGDGEVVFDGNGNFINHPSHAFCSQPVLGGPVYWIRNVAYNLPGGSSRFFGAAGVVFYNNTILSETTGTLSNTHWRNNLILGQAAPADFRRLRPNLFGITTFTNYTSSDYNGFGPAPDTPLTLVSARGVPALGESYASGANPTRFRDHGRLLIECRLTAM